MTARETKQRCHVCKTCPHFRTKIAESSYRCSHCGGTYTVMPERMLKKLGIAALRAHPIVRMDWENEASDDRFRGGGKRTGQPDHFAILPGGKLLGIEWKQREGEGKDHARRIARQRKWHEQARAAGAVVIECWRVEDLVALLNDESAKRVEAAR